MQQITGPYIAQTDQGAWYARKRPDLAAGNAKRGFASLKIETAILTITIIKILDVF